MRRFLSILKRAAASALLCIVLLPGSSVADSSTQQHDRRARLDSHSYTVPEGARLRVSPLKLNGGSKLTLISPKRWISLSENLENSLTDTHQRFTDLFGEIPAFKTSIRLMDEEDFYMSTGAPRWTNAMYYRGQIIIPLPDEGPVDFYNLARSITHEYTHAVVHSLSGGKCPGWLDEGLAQWAEGDENPALQPALLSWLGRNRPVPLNLLQGGFTKLEAKMVPAAYAQSLFAANTMIRNYGFEVVREYFDALRSGSQKRGAFERAFDMSERAFEHRLGTTLSNWAEKNRHPK